ncbi:uncharacterized protein LOC100680349 isoform X1 [Nasonia vitripennis]|uniref:Uncharacterized protein n=1 Tax=Nasonia vitripennis TaxID=7425 RepID=A0A7M7QP55_NASVI|nr:uncharacterized protein LOC100680349 isoform X1 [Nasonia vitripennis]
MMFSFDFRDDDAADKYTEMRASPADRLASAPVAAEAGPSAPGSSDAAPRCSNCITERLGAAGWHCEDDPPPYASLINASPGHHRVTWSYVFPGLPGYDAAAGASGNGAPENRTIARPLVSIPLTSYGIFKIEPPRYAAAMSQVQQPQMPRIMMSEPGPAVKSSNGRARKYGAILIAATVIVFLMALSLMVRFVTEKSLLSRG